MTSDTGSPPSDVRVTATAESAVTYTLAVEVDARRVRKAFDRAYRALGKEVRVKGFRPGKVPRSILERLYGSSVAEQLEQTLVAETLGEAIEQSGVEPVAEPAIEAETPRLEADFRYKARIDVKPEVVLPDVRGLPAVRPAVDVTDAEVDQELEALRQRHAPLIEEPEGTEVEEGLVACVDFVGRIEGEPFEGGSGKGVEIEIGSDRSLPGFEEQLVGARAGEDREVRVTFPEDYAKRELAGKEAVFACHVAAVKRRQPAELDDEFAKDLGEFDSLDALRQRIRDDLTEARERESKRVLRTSLLEALVEQTQFEVPPAMVERHLERELEAARRRLEAQVPEQALLRQLDRWREQWRERSEREVREMLILEAVAKAEDIRVEDSEIDAKIEEMASRQGVDAAALRKAYGAENLSHLLREQLSVEKTLDFLGREAKVERKTDT